MDAAKSGWHKLVMGREARCAGTWPGGAGEVHAVLEAAELILRGALKRRILLSEVAQVTVDGGDLRLAVSGEQLSLTLGVATAKSWAEAIAAPPKSLAKKLGIGPAARVFVVGEIEDAALREATAEARAVDLADAALVLAVVTDDTGVARALGQHAALPGRTPLWLVYGKGRGTAFGEAAVRERLRAAGYRDVKVASVSTTLSAAKFTR